MTWTLRILLIVVSLAATASVIGRIRRAKMQIEDAVFWVLFSFLLILLALCPLLLYFFTNLLGMQSPANLLFLVVIALLLAKVFSMSVKMSLLEEKLSTMAQEMALRDLALREAEGETETSDSGEETISDSGGETISDSEKKETSLPGKKRRV